ncbi:hypothetical protein Pcinc_033293 [Petrolisthes cinctipes]|uniref:Uncharacterized protein n=1 Tax=Petrolisthes cinctipes TaxID=88211 RepID=A0AAE1ESJ0_PETCI|nr:hypothetical protein Pcinc_033293 [Petrolisthes cinctipes]
MDSRSVNGTMTGGLWIEHRPWGSSSGNTTSDDNKNDAATPEKLLNLTTVVPGDYAEVDGPAAPLMPQQQAPPPGTPVAYATTNIIRTRNGEKVDQNIPVYGSMYGDGTSMDHHHHPMREDNLVLYCTLKKQQLYKPSLSPALNAKQPHVVMQRGYIPPWEQHAPPPLPENPPPDHHLHHQQQQQQQPTNSSPPPQAFPQQMSPQWRHQSPMINRAMAATGSLPRQLNKRKASPSVPKRGINTGDFDVNNDPTLPPPPSDLTLPGTPPARRDAGHPLQNSSGVGLQGLQGLSGSRMMGTPGAPRLAREYSPSRLPDMYGGSSIYQGPIDEEEEHESHYNGGSAIYTDNSAMYESTSAFYGSMGEKAFAADCNNPLLVQQKSTPSAYQHTNPNSLHSPHHQHNNISHNNPSKQVNGIKDMLLQQNLPPPPRSDCIVPPSSQAVSQMGFQQPLSHPR